VTTCPRTQRPLAEMLTLLIEDYETQRYPLV
jgi:hypothetical protein